MPAPGLHSVCAACASSFDSPSRVSTAREKTMPTARQRGFYSEILDSDMEAANAEQHYTELR